MGLNKSEISVPSGKDITQFFGEELRNMGFVSHKGGKEWYALKNGNILFSLIFVCDSVECNIYLRIQPLCTHIVYPVERYKGAEYDQRNHSINAESYYLWLNTQKGDAESHELLSLQGIERLKVLFDEVVVKFFASINDYSDVPNMQFIGTQYDYAAFAYLSGRTDEFYKNAIVESSYTCRSTVLPEVLPLYASMHEFFDAIYTAVKSENMYILGEHLLRCEQENANKLKAAIPALFKEENSYTPLTECFIRTHAVSEVRKRKSVNPAADEDDFAYEPVPDIPANLDITPEESLLSLKRVIAKHFAKELSELGFISRNDGMEWHKIINNCLYQRIYFSLHPMLFSVSIFYETHTLGDEIIIDANYEEFMASKDAGGDYFKLFNMTYKNEVYSNPFDSGEFVYEWQVRRLKRLLRHVVIPYMEQTKTLEGLCEAEPDCLSAICYLEKYELIPSEDAERYKFFAIMWNEDEGFSLDKKPYKISNKGHRWLRERERVLHVGFYHNDMNYLRNYYLKCREYNIEFLRKELPELFL